MRSFVSAVICLASINLASFAIADHHDDSVMHQLTGTWKVEEGVNQGEKLSEEELEGTTMKIDKKTIITYDRDENEKYRSTYIINASTKPISIDMTTFMKGVPPAKSLGILKLEDDNDELKICYALPGHERPTTFESPEGSQIMLFECEKEN